MSDKIDPRRRQLIVGSSILPIAAVFPVSSLAKALEITPRASEGPFYPTPDMRFADVDSDLVKIAGKVKAAGGEVVTITGRVKAKNGSLLANAVVEIWQCDVNGRYLHRRDFGRTERDEGFQGFGRSTTDAKGEFRFRTIKPVPYAGRTPHIHLKVWKDGRELLTSQLYLPDHPDNQRDFLYQRVPASQRDSVSLFFDQSDEPTADIELVV